MNLIDLETVAAATLPLEEFRAHLRLGSGFADDATSDGLLERYLRAAIAAVEAQTGKTLFARRFRLRLPMWRWSDAQAIPVAPVSAIESIVMQDDQGGHSTVSQGWRLVPDWHRPQIVATSATLPCVPTGGAVEITLLAGFSATWDGIPDDLRQAVLLMAATYYEGRAGVSEPIPATVQTLLARWKPVRVSVARGQ